jgi:excisionase family DNA binding protein
MKEAALLALPEGMEIDQIHITQSGLVVSARSTTPSSCCPLCSQPSSHIHSYYHRTLKDAPCVGRQLQLRLCVRKFLCGNPDCSRKVFAERIPDLAEPWARMTTRLREQITSIGLSTSGKAGVRLGSRLGIETTRPTILRRIMALPDEARASVVYLGIDDFAFRRGYRFGTIIVDLESHRPIDLLPDRRAETVAAWMRDNPDIHVVSRDRGSAYASAAAFVAPQATQVADRFHICKNLTEATQLLLARSQAEILAVSQTENGPSSDEPTKLQISIQEWRPPEPAGVKKARLARRAGRYARYQQVVECRQQGMTPKEIAGRLGLSDRTVQKWLAAGTFPEVRSRRKKSSSFDAFAPYVLKRWKEGEHKGIALYREIKAQGYAGSDRSVYRYLSTLKQTEIQAPRAPERIKKYTPNTAVWLFVRDPQTLDEIEQEDLAMFCQARPTLKRAYDLVQDFMKMVRKREGYRLDAWLEQVAASDLPELQSFAAGVEKDRDAVKAGRTTPVNNGQTEGQVTKLKLIKRQMYGKAGFALLRQRVLHAI